MSEIIKIMTPEFRGSFVNIIEAQHVAGDTTKEKKFSIRIVLPKDATLDRLRFIGKPFWPVIKAVEKKVGEAKYGTGARLVSTVADGDDPEPAAGFGALRAAPGRR